MRMRFIRHSYPAPVTKNYVVDQYLITRMNFSVGQSLTMEYMDTGAVNTLPSQHIQTTGIRAVEGNIIPPTVAGSMTQHDTYEIPPGVYTRVCTEAAENWCLKVNGNEDGDTSAVSSIRLEPSDSSVELAYGDRLFLIHGTVLINGNQIQAPKLVKASGIRLVSAINATAYFFKWPMPAGS
jgi:hypothetical protein